MLLHLQKAHIQWASARESVEEDQEEKDRNV